MDRTFGFEVFFTDEGGITSFAGRLAVKRNTSGQYAAVFRYDSAYKNSDRFPDLCPASLPKNGPNPIEIHRPAFGIPFAFEDAIPDAWGRALLIRNYQLSPLQSDAVHLLQIIERPIGALSFVPLMPTIVKELHTPQEYTLEQKIVDALAFSNVEQMSKERLLNMLECGTASGGARPKFTHSEKTDHWLVKPSSKEDRFPMIRAERLCLNAAAELGLRPIEGEQHRFITDLNVDVLLVRRFDLMEGGLGRRHVVSMRSLLGRDNNNSGSYQEMAEKLLALSSNAEEDCKKLFRLLLLNCAVGNIDDHLKNFSMTFAASEGWRFSPAYDITPACLANPLGGGGFHSIGFFKDEAEKDAGKVPDKEGMALLGNLMGLSATEIQKSAESVCDVVRSLCERLEENFIVGEDAILWRSLMQDNLGLLVDIARRPDDDLVEGPEQLNGPS